MRIELFLKKTGIIMVATCIVAVLNIVLNYICIPNFGFVAAGYTTLVCYALLALVHGINLKRLGYMHIYDSKRIIIISILMIIISILVMHIYQATVVRYILICLIFSITIWNREKIILMLKKR